METELFEETVDVVVENGRTGLVVVGALAAVVLTGAAAVMIRRAYLKRLEAKTGPIDCEYKVQEEDSE